jgi:hypothetical protein
MGRTRTTIVGSFGAAAAFGVLWHEIFTYARSLVYDWILARLLARFDPTDPRVLAFADFLALWGPILLVALLVAGAMWWATHQQRAAFRARAKANPILMRRALTDAERHASYQEALKGYPRATATTETSGRDTPISFALCYAASGAWGQSSALGLAFAGSMHHFDRALERFREAAEAGDLHVWGKRDSDGLYVLIDPAFWESNRLRREALISLMPRGETEPIGDNDTGERYHAIMVNRAEVERVWPHEG